MSSPTSPSSPYPSTPAGTSSPATGANVPPAQPPKAPEPPTISAKKEAPNATIDYSPILKDYTPPPTPKEGEPGYVKVQVREGEYLVTDVPGNVMSALPPDSVIGKTVDNQFIAYVPYRGTVHRILGDTNADVEQLVPKTRAFFQSQYHIGVPV